MRKMIPLLTIRFCCSNIDDKQVTYHLQVTQIKRKQEDSDIENSELIKRPRLNDYTSPVKVIVELQIVLIITNNLI